MADELKAVAEAVEKGKAKLVPGLVQAALDAGVEPTDILNKGMIDAMGIVGEKFKNNEIFVPEMLVAARAMKKGVDVLKPHLATGTAGAAGKMIMGTVAGDLHDIGKNLVIMMIESTGYEVVDLGIDVPIERFVEYITPGMASQETAANECYNLILEQTPRTQKRLLAILQNMAQLHQIQ